MLPPLRAFAYSPSSAPVASRTGRSRKWRHLMRTSTFFQRLWRLLAVRRFPGLSFLFSFPNIGTPPFAPRLSPFCRFPSFHHLFHLHVPPRPAPSPSSTPTSPVFTFRRSPISRMAPCVKDALIFPGYMQAIIFVLDELDAFAKRTKQVTWHRQNSPLPLIPIPLLPLPPQGPPRRAETYIERGACHLV